MSLYGFFDWILLQTFLWMSWASLLMITLRRRWSIVRFGTMIVCCSGYCFQYQFVFSCTEQRYCALTTNSPSVIKFPPILVLFCSVYASEMNWITYNQFAVVSSVLMKPYITDWTNEAIFSLILSRTTWCISSNTSKCVGFGVSSMTFQLLYETRTGH